MKILLVDNSAANLSKLQTAFAAKPELELTVAKSGSEALEHIKTDKVEAVAVAANLDHEDGLTWIKQAVPLNPFINYALSSSLSSEQFHEVTEGYGVFMQLSETPESKDAELFLEKLKKIASLS